MGTAVLHPQDCLAVPQSDQHRRFSCLSECPSSVAARPVGRAISATYEASIPAAECRRDVAVGNTIRNQGRGLLVRKNASAGLLPLPDQALQSIHSSFFRLAPKSSPCSSGGIVDPYVSKHHTSSHHSNFSLHTSDVHIPRYPSVPMVDKDAHTRRLFSECFPFHAVQLHERKPRRCDAKILFESAQGNSLAGSSPCAAGAAISCQKLKFLANSHFSDVFNPVASRTHPELSQVEVYLGRQFGKPPFTALPDGQVESICTNTSTVGRKHGVNKQLKRSASEKRQERSEVSILQRGTKEAAKKHTSNSFKGVVGSHSAKCHSSKIGVQLTSSTPLASSLEGNIEKCLQMQASLEVDTQGRMCVYKKGAARSSKVTLSRHKEVNEGYQMKGTSRSVNSVLDNEEMWVSMMNDEKWAGPSFFNSPSPSSLPVPSFTCKFSRTASTGSVPTKTADASMVSENSLLEAKRTWDVAFATMDLRRMLNLDHASCEDQIAL